MPCSSCHDIGRPWFGPRNASCGDDIALCAVGNATTPTVHVHSRASPLQRSPVAAAAGAATPIDVTAIAMTANTDAARSKRTGSGRREAQDPRGDDVLLDLRRAAHDALRPAVEVHLQPGVVGVEDRRRTADRERGVPDGLLDRRS